MGEFIELTAADGHRFQAYVAKPAGQPRGALVVAQEIFGVNSHIRSVADGYAADGYLAIAPALFDRARRGYDTGYSPEDIQAGIAVMQQVSLNDAMRDVSACVAWAGAAGAGKVGIVGYCWGGTVAWVAAARVDGLACAIPYYGGGIHGQIGLQARCPVLFQFADQDKSPTLAQAQEIAAAHPQAITHLYAANHGFNCDQRGSYDAASATLARQRALEFLGRHVG
jgi:carboxymethylenebutenolidase